MKTFIVTCLFFFSYIQITLAQDSLNVLKSKGFDSHGYIWQRIDSTTFECVEYFNGKFINEKELKNRLDKIYTEECSDKKYRLTIVCDNWLILIISYDQVEQDNAEEVIFSGKITGIDCQRYDYITIDNFIIESGEIRVSRDRKRIEFKNLKVKEYGKKI